MTRQRYLRLLGCFLVKKLDDCYNVCSSLLSQVRLQNGNPTDRSDSAACVRWRGLGILSLAPLDRVAAKRTYGGVSGRLDSLMEEHDGCPAVSEALIAIRGGFVTRLRCRMCWLP